MTFDLTKEFRFDAAHALERVVETAASRRIHGHSYRAVVTVRGEPDPSTGMVLDLGLFAETLEAARRGLDHHLLNEVESLGKPTLENLCVWIWRRIEASLPGLAAVSVIRDSTGDSCRYAGPREAR